MGECDVAAKKTLDGTCEFPLVKLETAPLLIATWKPLLFSLHGPHVCMTNRSAPTAKTLAGRVITIVPVGLELLFSTAAPPPHPEMLAATDKSYGGGEAAVNPTKLT